MAIVTVDDVAVLSNVAFDLDTEDVIATLIDLAQGEIETYLDRPVEPKTAVETHSVDYMAPSIRLENAPVTNVTSISADGVTLPTTGYTVQPWGIDLIGYGVWFPGSIGLPGFPGPSYDPVLIQPEFAYGSPGASGVAGWPYPGRNFTISYTGGLDGANIAAIKSVLIRTVLRLWTWVKQGDLSRGKFTSISVEDFSLRSSTRGNTVTKAQGMIDAEDIALLNAYRRKMLV